MAAKPKACLAGRSLYVEEEVAHLSDGWRDS